MRTSRHLTTVSLLVSLILAPAVWAQAPEQILDHSGQLQRALAGPYGELFADGDSDDAVPVLAVETVTPTGDAVRALVPGTEDSRLETDPRLFQDPQRDSFVLLWRSLAEDGDGRLDFAAFDGAEWSDVLTLERDGSPVSPADDLRIVETHDAFELELDDGESIRAERMIVHLLWRSGEQAPGAYYAPLTFVAGRYLGWHGVVALDDLFLHGPEDDFEPVELTAALARVLQLRAADDDRSVVVTFANSSSHRIGSLEISPLPLELGLLGEQVREQIFALADLYDPDDLSSFAGGMRAAIVIIGLSFDLHDAQAGYVADQVADWILTTGASYGWDGLENLGADARDLTIDAAREVTVSTSADPADPDSEIVRLDVSELFEDQEPDPMQVFHFRPRCDLPAPAIGEQPVGVFTSRRGRNLLVAWLGDDGGQAHWVESRRSHDDDSWSEVFSLPPGEQLTVNAARELLAKRIR